MFDVAGVAVDGVLNIRAAPNASARIVGELPPDARNIEVVGYDESAKWACVIVVGQSGWGAFRFLDYRVDVWQPEELPTSLRCYAMNPGLFAPDRTHPPAAGSVVIGRFLAQEIADRS